MEATCDSPLVSEVKKEAKMEDKLKLRELELQTQYEIKYLSDSFNDLRQAVKESRDAENTKFEQLNKKVNWLWWMILAQLAGADAQMLMTLFKTLG